VTGEIKYEKKTVQTVRGTEGVIASKLAKDGWELVDQQAGRLKVTLNFQRPKKPVDMLLVGGGIAAAVALAAVIGIGAALEGDGKKTDDAEPKPTSVSATESPSKEAVKAPTKITVDELLDKLNAAGLGGIKTGDRFDVTGEMVESDAWGVGASGDYAVYLKAKGGADDLLVLMKDEGQAGTLRNGTKVRMVLEASEVTINEEKTDGWMRAVSVKVLSGVTTSEAKAAGAEDEMFKDLADLANTFNTAFGAPAMISSIEPGSAPGVVYVQLHAGLLSVDVDVAQQAVTKINEQIIETVGGNDAFSGMVKYFIGSELVGQNRSIVDPYAVSFKAGLED
jgi:hypothetical protein